MNQDNLTPIYFRSLELSPTSWTRWIGSIALHAAFIVLLIAIPWTVHEAIQPKPQEFVRLFEPAPQVKIEPPRHIVPPPPVKVVQSPPVPQPVAVTVPPPRAFIRPVQPPKPAPQKSIVVQEAPAPAPAQQQVAKLELPSVEPPAIQPPPKPVKMGGFGDTNGAKVSPASSSNSIVAKVGAFDLAPGSQEGNGHPGRRVAVAGFGSSAQAPSAGSGHGGRGVAQAAGFGDATQGSGSGPGGGNGHGLVHTAGFEQNETAPAAPHVARVIPPAETPVQITFKPKPVYTPQAREKRIEGEVLLEILFSADGQVRVLRVMRGLGFGLDESARAAASQIRFQPGTRGGSPVDMKGTVHIVFELS